MYTESVEFSTGNESSWVLSFPVSTSTQTDDDGSCFEYGQGVANAKTIDSLQSPTTQQTPGYFNLSPNPTRRSTRSKYYFKNNRKWRKNISETKFSSYDDHNTTDNRPYALVKIADMTINGLLDSGANISALGKGSEKFINDNFLYLHCISASVQTASGTAQKILGYVKVPVEYNGKLVRMRIYVVPDLQQELYLGCDFWEAFGLKPIQVEEIELKPKSSTDDLTSKQHPLTATQRRSLQRIIDDIPSSEKLGLGRTSVLHHEIDVGDATPVKQRFYPVSPAVQKDMYSELDRMLALGVIEESNSPWCSPMAIVRKQNGKARLCLDARKLNKVTKKDAYPLPLIEGLLSRLDRVKYISKLDLKDAFWQVPLHPNSKERTAFTVPGRPLYHFNVMPFGLCNAPQTLCRLMHKVIPHHLHDRVFVYLDDLLITTSTFDEHLSLLSDISSRLAAAGLTINVEKSQFLLKEMEYLGYVVGGGCLRPNAEKVAAIAEFPPPKTVRQIRRFLGVSGWYRRFIPNYSTLAAPLTNLLKKGNKFIWSDDAQSAFDALKLTLTTSPFLSTPDFDKRFYIQCDASSTGIGAVLFQKDENNDDRPIAYVSQKLNSAQRNYSVTELECLAAVQAVKKFRCFVEGLPFTVITDHSSLTWLMSQKDLSGRLARWSLKLQSFDFDIEYRKGSQNTVPDALSRVNMDEIICPTISEIPSDSIPLSIDLDSDAFRQPEYVKLLTDVQQNPGKSNLSVQNGRIYINVTPGLTYPIQDTPAWKLVVPESLRPNLVRSSHCPPTSAHLGIAKTTEILKRHYFWPTLNTDVNDFISKCGICKSNKAPNQISRPPLSSLPMTFRPWQRLYLDFLGPYPRTRQGNTSIFIVLDHYSKFVFTCPVRQATASAVVEFLEKHIFLTFGVPEVIVTDNGRQFESNILDELLKKYGVRHIFTAKYSPQANASERVNRTLLAALRSYIKEDQRTWDSNLGAVTQALRNAVHDSTGFSPYFLVFGQHLVQHGSSYQLLKDAHALAGNFAYLDNKPESLFMLQTTVQKHLLDARQKSHHQYNMRSRPRKFTVGQEVYVRNFTQSKASEHFSAKLAPKFIKGKISRLDGNVMCEVVDENNKSLGVFHFKDIKP